MKRLIILALLLCACSVFADANIPGTYNLQIEQGGDFSLPMVLSACQDNPLPVPPAKCKVTAPVNLSGYSFKAQARTQPTSTVAFANFSANVTNAALGQYVVKISHGTTAAIAGKAGYWDLLMQSPNGSLDYLLKGQIYISPTVTR